MMRLSSHFLLPIVTSFFIATTPLSATTLTEISMWINDDTLVSYYTVGIASAILSVLTYFRGHTSEEG